MKHLQNLIDQKKMIILGGTGGVGKTTLSAALALKAAKSGKKTAVLTIDPSKRLATTLSIDILNHKPQRVPLKSNEQLWAMTLDTRQTFDDIIKKYAPSKEVSTKILDNKIYQFLASSMAGTQEYMALEKLYELYEQNKYDLIILDTPPSKHALSFLEAPDRLANFLDERILKWFVRPYFQAGKFSLKLLSSGSSLFFRMIEKITGLKLLQDLSEFLLNLQTFYSGFRERTLKAKAILKSEETSFLIVTNPENVVFEQAIEFHNVLLEQKIHLEGILINRVTQTTPLSEKDHKEIVRLKQGKLSSHDQALLTIFEQHENLALREKKQVTLFKKHISKNVPSYEIPFFEKDIHDINGLNLLNLHIFR